MREETRGPGRPREFDEDAALEKIMALFWRAGFEGTSLADIMAATGLRKASLYAAFGDKDAMYLKALGRYHEQTVLGAAVALRGPGDPKSRISAFLSAPIEAISTGQDRSGCFLCNASADRAALSPETAAIVSSGFQTLAGALSDALAECAPDRPAAEHDARAWMLLSVYSGLRIMARSGVELDSLKAARDTALADLG